MKFTSANLKILVVGIILLIVGYVLLSRGPADNHLSISVAPVILIVTYTVVFPLAILYKGKGKKKE